MSKFNYGVVIDSGSSGSRVQIYKWRQPSPEDQSLSPPEIFQEPGWSTKILPGISTFAQTPKKAWNSHYKKLIEFAEKIIPLDQIPQTPIHVLLTAGMRLLPYKQSEALLAETCKQISRNSKFLIESCRENIQIIDGSTEGIYGWLALNYLMGLFNNYENSATKESIGFMDMGGASTQIAFMPGADEVLKHHDDLSTVVIRNSNGQAQEWKVFVETWLGFGANQARNRYLHQLIQISTDSNKKLSSRTILDPCMPAGAMLKKYEYRNKKYNIKGTGNYNTCLRDIYPLLMKHLPCNDDPCLFNGVHGPKMNFETDKFVGISEYWYTANDVFHSGGEYNFHGFSEKVREYCDSDWNTILENSKNGEYSGLEKDFLLDACFKASWVINVLHEGFGLPRLGLEINGSPSKELEEADRVHVPFKSANSVNGEELAWTLGKILLVASSQIVARDSMTVGIYNKPIQRLEDEYESDIEDAGNGVFIGSSFLIFFFLAVIFVKYPKVPRSFLMPVMNKFNQLSVHPKVKNFFNDLRGRCPRFLQTPLSGMINYLELLQMDKQTVDLEEGSSGFVAKVDPNAFVLRTRSAISLPETVDDERPKYDAFKNKIFLHPKKNLSFHN